MLHFIRSISARTEFVLVTLIAFGYFILGSLLTIFYPTSNPPISNNGLHFLITYELIILILLALFLLLRGWSYYQIGLIPTTRDTLMGIGLAVFSYLGFIMVYMILSVFVSQPSHHDNGMVASGLSFSTILVVSALNPLFEEVFVCGYVIEALKKTHSITYAANISIAIRLAYHLYQGAAGVINIVPLGFIFAYWYAITKRLWPVIVAHAIFDFWALTFYSKS